MPQKALPLVAKGDTALARLDRCSDRPEYVRQVRYNNITIGQAMIYAANGQHDKAEALYLKHRQSERPAACVRQGIRRQHLRSAGAG